MDQNGHHSITEQTVSNLSWVTYMIFLLINWILERGKKSVEVMEGSWGCIWGAPKWIKFDQDGHRTMTDQTVSKLSWMTNMIFFWIRWTFERGYDLIWLISPLKCPSNPEKDYISHPGQLWNSMICHAMATILVNSYPFWCILVHLICNPMTPPWLLLTLIPFQVSS